MIKISTSILSAKNRIETIKKLNTTKSDYLHIDIMDGIFVKNIAFPIQETNNLISYSQKPIDIHLMVNNPNEYIDNLNNPLIEFITFHIEIKQNISLLIKKIKNKGYKVGLSIKPQTKVEKLLPYINDIDMILVMSVEPGYGGQKFNSNVLNKIKKIRNYNKNIIISVDGGINNTNITLLTPNINIAVVGSFITNSSNYNETINILKN